jgi:hypothetical protein
VAAQIGKKDGAYLSPSEVSWIAGHYGTDYAPQAFIALSAFGDSCQTWPYIEDGVAANVKLLHAANPKVRVLEYWGFHGDWRPSCMRAFTDPTYLANAKTWRGSDGKLDISQQALRDWWTDAVVRMVSQGNLDGMYIDGLQNLPNDDQAALKVSLFAELRTKLAALNRPILIIANGSAGYLGPSGLTPYIDGIMTEGFDRVTSVHPNPPTPADNLAYLQGSWALTQSHRISMMKEWPHPYDFSNWPTGWTYAQRLAYTRSAAAFELACLEAIYDPSYTAVMYSGGYDSLEFFDVITNPTADPSTWAVDPAWYADLAGPNPAGVPLGPPTFDATANTVDRDFTGGHLHVDLVARTFSGIPL